MAHGIDRYTTEKSAKAKQNRQQPSQAPAVKAKTTPKPTVLRDACGCTALHVAVHKGREDDVASLLQKGSNANIRDDWDETALHFAARGGSLSMCKLLLSAGADLDAVNANGETPLFVAGIAKQEAAAELLLDRGATVAGASADQIPATLNMLLFCRMVQPTELTV